jgi:hypothetical protein
MNSWTKYISKLDSERFGFNIAKINAVEGLTLQTFDEIKVQDIKLIIARVNAKSIDDLNKLEGLGFNIKDIQTTYRYFLKELNFNGYTNNPNLLVRDFRKEDIKKLMSITEESFNGYGHYFADKNLDHEKCLEIYKDWTFRSCNDINVADKVFVAEVNGQVAGFLSFKIFNTSEGRFAAGGLGAVKKEFRNQDVFRGITKCGLLWGKELDLEWEEHNVLVNNFSVNNSFSKIGFKVYKSFITLHKWL